MTASMIGGALYRDAAGVTSTEPPDACVPTLIEQPYETVNAGTSRRGLRTWWPIYQSVRRYHPFRKGGGKVLLAKVTL